MKRCGDGAEGGRRRPRFEVFRGPGVRVFGRGGDRRAVRELEIVALRCAPSCADRFGLSLGRRWKTTRLVLSLKHRI